MREFKNDQKLTEKESTLFEEIITKYDDECGFLWVSQLTSFSGKTLSGLISSLSNKNLICSSENEDKKREIDIWVIDQETQEIITY